MEPTSVDDWLALVELFTVWLPLEFTWTPGLMLAEALRSVLLMPTFASTPTFGFTLRVGARDVPEDVPLDVPLVAPLADGDMLALADDCVPADCEVDAAEPVSVELAETPLFIAWPPLTALLEEPGEVDRFVELLEMLGETPMLVLLLEVLGATSMVVLLLELLGATPMGVLLLEVLGPTPMVVELDEAPGTTRVVESTPDELTAPL